MLGADGIWSYISPSAAAGNAALFLDRDGVLVEEVKVGCTVAMLQCLDRPHRLAYIVGEILDVSGPEAAEILLLQGAAELRFEGQDPIKLTPGSFVNIPAHTRHRVEWTDRIQLAQ